MSRTLRLLQEIHDQLCKIQRYIPLKNPSSFLLGEREDLETIPTLIDIIQNEIDNFSSQDVNNDIALKNFLRLRWNRIANTLLCYTQNTSHPYNLACILLAKYIDDDNKNIHLMPGVAEQDIYSYEFKYLEFGEFIISDDKTRFICLDALVNSACSRIVNAETPLYVTADTNGNTINLTQAELSRCKSIISTINSIQSWYQRQRGSLFDELIKLRNCLLHGDASHGGEELNAGSAANVGIANFYAIYSTLNEEIKIQLRSYSDGSRTIGDILDQLFRSDQQNFREVRFCIQILGRSLEGILNQNAAALSGMQLSQHRNLQNLINLVKSQLCDLTIENEVNEAPAAGIRSQLDPTISLNEHTWAISLIAPKSHLYIPTYCKITVEGIKNGKLYIGSFYVITQANSTWQFIPAQIQNTPGIIKKIKVFESRGYAQIPDRDSTGQLNIDGLGRVALKFDQINEMRKSLSRSHAVPASNVLDMINSIKKDACRTDFANWVTSFNIHSNDPKDIDRITTNSDHYSLYIPHERFGAFSFFGSGKDNCVTWSEQKLAIAGCSKTVITDSAKAKPLMHVLNKLW